MVVDVGIWLFKVGKCGYYPSKTSKTGSAPVFGNLASTLSELSAWSQGRLLSETSTYDVEPDSDLTKTYLLGMRPGHNGDYLVALWNGLQSNSNKIASVGVNDIVGNVTTEFTEIDANRIPGFATYIWVMPSEGAIATVRVKHRTNGLRNFEHYFESFLRFINPAHVVLGESGPEDEIVITGYRENLQDPDVKSLHGTFKVKSIQKAGESEFILAHAISIEKVICKTTLTNQVKADRAWWQSGLDLLGMGVQHGLIDTAAIKLEMPIKFTTEELQVTLDNWQQKMGQIPYSWDDIGFKLTGEQSPRWLGKSYARKDFGLELQWLDSEQVELESLLGQLQKYRAEVLAMEE